MDTLTWSILSVMRDHRYDYKDKGGKPDDPGWHVCACGWEGYWCDFEPHVAEKIALMIPWSKP